MRAHTAHKFTISWECPMYFFFQTSQVNLHCCESKRKLCCYYRVSWCFISKSKNVACFRLNILSPLIMFWSYEIMLCPCKACEGFLLFRWHDDSICKLSTGLIKIFVPFLHSSASQCQGNSQLAFVVLISTPDLPTVNDSSHVWLFLSHDNCGLECFFLNNNNKNKACIILYWIMTGTSCNSIIKYHAYCIAANKHKRSWDVWI